MVPKYKLTYFPIKALAESARLIFAYAKVDYEDVRIEFADWPAIKPEMPWNVLPVLEEDGKQLSQNTAIVRYLGQKFGLAGANEWETAKCNEYVDAVNDVRIGWSQAYKETDETRKAADMKILKEETLPKLFQKLDEILKKNGTGVLVGNGITYADIYAAFFIEYLAKVFDIKDKLQTHQELITLIAKVNSSPGIAEWIAKRPVTEY